MPPSQVTINRPSPLIWKPLIILDALPARWVNYSVISYHCLRGSLEVPKSPHHCSRHFRVEEAGIMRKKVSTKCPQLVTAELLFIDCHISTFSPVPWGYLMHKNINRASFLLRDQNFVVQDAKILKKNIHGWNVIPWSKAKSHRSDRIYLPGNIKYRIIESSQQTSLHPLPASCFLLQSLLSLLSITAAPSLTHSHLY